jgi:hypothetical protein
MYKTRIRNWKFKKSFKLEKLEAAAIAVGQFIQAGLNAPTANIGGREVPIQRSKRHFPTLLQANGHESLRRTICASTERGKQSIHNPGL